MDLAKNIIENKYRKIKKKVKNKIKKKIKIKMKINTEKISSTTTHTYVLTSAGNI